MATKHTPPKKQPKSWKGKPGPSRLADDAKPAPLATVAEVADKKPTAAAATPKLDTAPPAEGEGETRKGKAKGKPNGDAGTPTPAPARIVPFDERPTSVHYLPVKLDEGALRVRSEQHVSMLDEIDRKREERRKAVASHSAAIKDLQAQADKMRDTLRTGREEQPVECREVPDWQTKVVRLIRLDTNEVVSRRPMVEGELQIALSFPMQVARQKLAEVAGKACTCDPATPGVHKIDCPAHGVAPAPPSA